MLSFTSPRTGLAVTPAALPDRIVVRLRPVADQAERTGRGQGGDGSGGVACIAGDVNPRGGRVDRQDGSVVMARLTGALGLVVPAMAALTGRGRVHRRQAGRLAVAGEAPQAGMVPVRKGHQPL